MAIKRTTSTWKARDDIFDNITPNNVVQPNVSVPAGEWKPAAWLPIVWTGDASKDSFTISSGKVVSLDRQGRVVPSGYKKIIEAATNVNDVIITYTSADVKAGVISLETGKVCTVSSVKLGDLAQGLLDRGLVLESDIPDASYAAGNKFVVGTAADCVLVCSEFFSEPVGICAYDVYVWAGDSPETLNFTNYQKQHLVQFFTDIQLQVPHITSAAFTTANLVDSALQAWGTTFGEEFPDALAGSATELLVTRAQLSALSRYGTDIPADVVAIGLEHNQIAANTERTPISSSGSTLARERSSIDKISKAGDWYLDADVGLLIVFESGGDASPFAAGETVTYYHYGATVSSQWQQVSAVGKLLPGDFVTYDKYSNFVKSTAVDILAADDSVVASIHLDIIGRVLALQNQPKGLLERVRTAWDGSSFDSSAKMPGTATKGYTDLITLSKETVSDQIAIINVKLS